MKYYKKSDEELRKTLSKIQYDVTQKSGTERPFSGEYDNFFEDGIYVDITSGQPLFSSKDKFNSGCGWPAFSKVIENTKLIELRDERFGMHRIEVRSNADAHLGHLFNDGPKELGGLRYCINSASLKFIPKDRLKEEGYEEYLKIFYADQDKNKK